MLARPVRTTPRRRLFGTRARDAGGAPRRWAAACPGPALCFAVLSAPALLGHATARADEPRSVTEPRVMQEPGEVVDVIDAFDDGDDFDLNVSLGFSYETKSARILRETYIQQPGLTTGGYTADTMNVAEYSSSTSRLIPRVDIGAYQDLAFYLELPIILNHSRDLAGLDGSDSVQATVLAGAPGEQLFGLPFQSPDRSGPEYFAVGVNYSPFNFNQARDPSKPTWLFGTEIRFPIGEPMHACNANPASGQVECAHPADVDRDGSRSGDLEGEEVGPLDPGVARGVWGLQLHTYMSRRIKYIEPYWGFEALFEFPAGDSEFESTNFRSSVVNHPPLRGKIVLGSMFIPWEYREKYGRLTFDVRLEGDYISEGRDYSELFDALGSSPAPSLRNPNYARYTGSGASPDDPACTDNDPGTFCPVTSVADTSNPSYFTGLTTVQAHGSYRASGSVTWQASEFVKFTFGLGFRHDQAHFLNQDKACNADFKNDLNASGPCRRTEADGSVSATGIPNPNHRPTIDVAGRRFLVDSSNTFDIFARGVVMF